MEQGYIEIDLIEETAEFLVKYGFLAPEVGIILGTGLGKLAEYIEIEKAIDYSNIPNFPVSTVEFHRGRLIYGELGGKKVIAMQGRFHYYEGYNQHQITFPVRVMKMLGVSSLLVSNACGAMNTTYKKGSLMLLDDHINLLPGSPLVGHNYDKLGPRYPDMSRPYSVKMNKIIRNIAQKEEIQLHEGVYVAVSGPNLETRAEYRFLRTIGADVVGMSTVPEVIVANHMDMPVAAISVVTDECDPDNLEVTEIDEIVEIANKAEKYLVILFRKLIEEL